MQLTRMRSIDTEHGEKLGDYWAGSPSSNDLLKMAETDSIYMRWGMEFDYAGFYDYVVSQTPPKSLLVEVGCYRGVSLVHLARATYAKDSSIQCLGVDWGLGIPVSVVNHDGTKDWHFTGMTANDALLALLQTKIPYSVPVLMWDSSSAAKFIPNRSCFMVYIDADHSTEAATKDIRAWAPKIQRGGILCGHDYDLATVRKAVDSIFGPCDDKVPSVWAVQRTLFGWRALNR